MIEIIQKNKGSIFRSSCEMIVNPVNVVGVMGAGLAHQFRLKYPGIWVPYKEKCKSGWELGTVLTLQNPKFKFPLWIVCYPTKIHWRSPSSMDIIQKSMEGLFDEIACTGVKSLALPALGCGLGGLSWNLVKAYLLSLPFPDFLTVKIYEPRGS